ncbi:uncharacterized protein LOC129919380 [Episyrphus balteatus]|uniref:uncharacterized protein LOC129919380 n=1 Tax=Episyrphus balteatus TaxID=286459 RepID=UPI00248666CC|nr:uncharacterized protein LOC129919380 [Episyrphus balteatus]
MITILQLFLFIQIVLIGSIECKKEVKFLSVSVNPNTKFLEFCDASITPDSNGHSLDLKTRLLAPIQKDIHVRLDFFMKSKQDSEYKEFFAYDFDVCKLMDDFMSQTLARLWMENMVKYTNIPFKCPVAEGEYYIKKLVIDEKSLPMVAVSGIYMVKILTYVKEATPENTLASTTLEVEVKV